MDKEAFHNSKVLILVPRREYCDHVKTELMK